MAKSYEDSGSINRNGSKNQPNHPDWRGTVTLSRATLKKLVLEADAGNPAKLSLSIWEKGEGQYGEWMSVSAQHYEPRENVKTGFSKKSKEADDDWK